MKKRTKKLLVFTLLALILVVCIMEFTSVTISGRSYALVENYSKYYLFKVNIELNGFLNIGVNGARPGYKVWFLPGQKAKLVDRIEADVRALLDDLAANNSDLVQGYEISEDFQDISIYLYMHETSRKELGKRVDLEALAESIIYRVEFYNQILHGYFDARTYGSILSYKEAK